MPSLPIVIAVTFAAVVLLPIVAFSLYVVIRYSPIVARIFEEKPLFLPLRVPRTHDGEDMRFPTRQGLLLAGTYLKTRSAQRSGVLIFCHEYLSDRWSVLPYLDHLRDHGFDILTFDFRNHGESDRDEKYSPLQWVTQYEIRDLEAAIDYLRTRPDADPAGFGLFGVSRGGGTALCVAATDRGAWGVITDGAFPTRGTMVAYMHRWAEIYVQLPWLWKFVPGAIFELLAWSGRMRTQIRLGCRYSNVEQAVARLSPRPWLSIHGAKDAYIGVAIAERLFQRAGSPKELWIVPKAKHNRCREKEPVAYRERVLAFYGRFSPRRPQQPVLPVPAAAEVVPVNPELFAVPDDFASLPSAQDLEVAVPL